MDNAIDFIINSIRLNDNKVKYVVQHSYNPNINNTIHFYVYSNKNKLSYIVSTYRKSSKQLMKRQNEIMQNILNRINSNEIKNAIVFSFQVINWNDYVFRIQEYINHSKNTKKLHKEINQYIKSSFDWLYKFQKETVGKIWPAENIKTEIVTSLKSLQKKYSNQKNLNKIVNDLLKNIAVIHSPLPVSASHGDFFIGNYFFDTNNHVKIIDWEYANSKELVSFDFTSNIMGYAIYFDFNIVRSFYSPKTHIENLIQQEIKKFLNIYKLNFNELMYYLIYTKIILLTREGRKLTNDKINQLNLFYEKNFHKSIS